MIGFAEAYPRSLRSSCMTLASSLGEDATGKITTKVRDSFV